MNYSKILLLILLMSAAEYFVTFARRKLIIKHDDRFILLLEGLIIFTVMTLSVMLFTKKKDIHAAISKFERSDLITILITSILTVGITVIWTAVIDENELSKVQFLSTGLDLFIAIAGGYLLLNEGLTTRKVAAFSLLLLSLYLLSY